MYVLLDDVITRTFSVFIVLNYYQMTIIRIKLFSKLNLWRKIKNLNNILMYTVKVNKTNKPFSFHGLRAKVPP